MLQQERTGTGPRDSPLDRYVPRMQDTHPARSCRSSSSSTTCDPSPATDARPARTPKLIHDGRRIAVAGAEVVDADGRLIAVATGSAVSGGSASPA
jgi:hypothetical protein